VDHARGAGPRYRLGAGEVGAFALLCLLAVAAAPVPPAPSVRYRDGLLSVQADGIPLAAVLQAIEAETGLRFRGEPLDERQVWKRFDEVPLAEGLRRVIGRQNFTLTYGEHGAPLRVDLRGVPTPRPTRVTPPSLPMLWRTQAPVPVSARVAGVLGGARSVRLAELVPALRSDDAAVRQDAVAALLLAVHRSPALRSALLALSEVQAAAFARAWAGPHAADILRTIGQRTVYGDVRSLVYGAARRL
jgi:hypothetical protein